jgi:hypothetical protein
LKFRKQETEEDPIILIEKSTLSDDDSSDDGVGEDKKEKFAGIGSGNEEAPKKKKKKTIIGKLSDLTLNMKSSPESTKTKKVQRKNSHYEDSGLIPMMSPKQVNSHAQGMVEYKGILKIKLFGAARLVSKESTCNAYFSFRCGSQSIQSKVVKKSNSPYFEREELMVCMNSKDEPLLVICFDKISFKDRLIGTAVTLVDDCFDQPGLVKEFTLNLIDQKKVTGTVEFSAMFELFKH